MKKFTQKELIEELRQGDPDHKTSEVVLLEDTIWELTKGVYRPAGELRLPLQYFNGDYDDGGKHYVVYGLLTVLSRDFFEGITPRMKENSGRIWGATKSSMYIEDHIDALRGSGKKYNYSEGRSDETSARKIVEEFVAEFFKLYLERNSYDHETRESLQKGFIKYLHE